MPFTVQEYAEDNLWLADEDLLIVLYNILRDEPAVKIWTTMPPQWAAEEIAEEVAAGNMVDLGDGSYEYTRAGQVHHQERERRRVPKGMQQPLF